MIPHGSGYVNDTGRRAAAQIIAADGFDGWLAAVRSSATRARRKGRGGRSEVAYMPRA